MQGKKARSWRFKIATSQLREPTLTENIGPAGQPGFGHGADNPTPEKNSCYEIWKSNSWILQLAEASEEGQGPRRAVEPMMMLTNASLCDKYFVLNLNHKQITRVDYKI
jgi:hypothetical protein